MIAVSPSSKRSVATPMKVTVTLFFAVRALGGVPYALAARWRRHRGVAAHQEQRNDARSNPFHFFPPDHFIDGMRDMLEARRAVRQTKRALDIGRQQDDFERGDEVGEGVQR